MTAASATALRRATALLLDLVLPALPAAVLAGMVWSVVRPDRADGFESLGAAILVVGVGILVWAVGFVANEVVIAARQGRTLGERARGFALVLPDDRGPRVLRLVGRAVLRGGVAWLALSAVGLASQVVGEDVAGVALGTVAAALVLFGACRLGAHGPTTIVERVVGLEVRDEAGRPARPPA